VKFDRSVELGEQCHAVIPGAAHTYAKGEDQYPQGMAPFIVRGEGCHVWDLDGNEFIEYGMGLRAVTLGHANRRVVEATYRQMLKGANFVRPSPIEYECGQEFLRCVRGAEMVKFAKNGSDATSAAVRLSRGHTGRDLIAICADHPFFSVDDWFIGTTPMNAGIPKSIRGLTVSFRYNDLESVKTLFERHPGEVACLIMEAEKDVPPRENFLHQVKQLCQENGTVFVLDEMITGFRWDVGGGQRYHNITPDLSCFGKAMGNGFSIAALAGKREIMELGGIRHDRERVFLLSTTHGAETHSLAAGLETMRIYREEPVIEHLWRQGQRLADGVRQAVICHDLEGYVEVIGRPCCLGYATRDQDKKPSQLFRTLFLQETIKRGLLAPSLVVSYSHTDQDIDRTVSVIDETLSIYRKALEDGGDQYLIGRPVKPVFRKFC
jgi:glutamate-1-semialdehyde 2,1-aminomutase